MLLFDNSCSIYIPGHAVVVEFKYLLEVHFEYFSYIGIYDYVLSSVTDERWLDLLSAGLHCILLVFEFSNSWVVLRGVDPRCLRQPSLDEHQSYRVFSVLNDSSY